MNQTPPPQPRDAQPPGNTPREPGERAEQNQSDLPDTSGHMPQQTGKPIERATKATRRLPAKILSTGGLLIAIVLALLLGLAFVLRSLKNIKLSLRLMLRRNEG